MTIENYLRIKLRKPNLHLLFVGEGSERGYNSKKSNLNGFVYCGVVTHGKRKGLHKFQGTGKGGPYNNSTYYVSNFYYAEI